MKAVGIVGASGSGKTTLITSLLAILARRGLRVGTIKHTHHRISLPDKRATAFAGWGAREILLAGPCRLLQFGNSDEILEPEAILRRLKGCDLVLVEGFKGYGMPKIEVWRSVLGRPTYQPGLPGLIAVAGDFPPSGLAVHYLPLDDLETIAQFLVDQAI